MSSSTRRQLLSEHTASDSQQSNGQSARPAGSVSTAASLSLSLSLSPSLSLVSTPLPA